jgi:putative methionine-R-sulfoxide reductase with GAF domain
MTTTCLVLDDAAEHLVCRAAEGQWAETLTGYRLPLGRGVAGTVALGGQAAGAAGLALDPGALEATRQAVGFPVRNALCVPLIAGEGVFGALEVLNATNADGFTARDADLLGILAEQVAVAMEVASRLERTRHGFLRTVEYLADLLAAPEGAAHCHPRSALPLADGVVRRLGLPDETARIVELTHILHDVGSASVGQELPYEPRELTDSERATVCEHAAMGGLLLQPLSDTWMSGAVAGVKHHHERVDGAGYPDGLGGEAIPAASRIAAVIHAYLAMTEGRPYRRARTPAEAIEELRCKAGSQFDCQVVEALAACVETSPQGSACEPTVVGEQ